jgi:hypothetical protein
LYGTGTLRTYSYDQALNNETSIAAGTTRLYFTIHVVGSKKTNAGKTGGLSDETEEEDACWKLPDDSTAEGPSVNYSKVMVVDMRQLQISFRELDIMNDLEPIFFIAGSWEVQVRG